MIHLLEGLGSSATLVKTPVDAKLPRSYRLLLGAAALLFGIGFAIMFISVVASFVVPVKVLSWLGGGMVLTGLGLRIATFAWRVVAIVRYRRIAENAAASSSPAQATSSRTSR